MTQSEMATRARVIELFGLPGAGKSAVVNAFADQPSTATALAWPTPLRYRSRPRLRRLVMLLGIHFRSRSLALAAYQLALDQGSNRWVAARRVPAFLVDVERMSHASKQLKEGQSCIFKQGALQQLRQLLIDPHRPQTRLASVVRKTRGAVRPRLRWHVVVVDTSAATSAERVGARPRDLGRYDRMSHADRVKVLAEEYEAQNLILRALNDTGVAEIQWIDGEVPLGEARKLASAVFLTIIGQTGEAAKPAVPLR